MSTGSSSRTPAASAGLSRIRGTCRAGRPRRGWTPTSKPLRRQEREAHRAADQQPVDALQQVVDHAELVGDLGAAEDRHERSRRVVQQPCQRLPAPPAGASRPRRRAAAPARRRRWHARGAPPRRRRRRRPRPAPRARRRSPARWPPRPARSAGSPAARPRRRRGPPTMRPGRPSRPRPRPRARRAEQLRPAPRPRAPGAVPRIDRALGPPEVAEQTITRAPAPAQAADRRQRLLDAQVVGDRPVRRQRHVEVDAHEHAPATASVERREARGASPPSRRSRARAARRRKAVRSTRRQE